MADTTDPTGAAPSIGAFRAALAQGRIVGLRSGCGFVTATWGLLCPRCGQRDLAPVELSGTGTVAAATVQTVPSEEFRAHAPYVYALVDLPEGGRISGWIPLVPGTRPLAAGEKVRLVASPQGVRFERA
jgi:uncharacterized OB-fold protein